MHMQPFSAVSRAPTTHLNATKVTQEKISDLELGETIISRILYCVQNGESCRLNLVGDMVSAYKDIVNKQEVEELCTSILNKFSFAANSNQNIAELKFDLGKHGQYTLIEKNGHLIIQSCDDGTLSSPRTIGVLPQCKLEEFLNYFKEDLGIFEDFVITEDSNTAESKVSYVEEKSTTTNASGSSDDDLVDWEEDKATSKYDATDADQKVESKALTRKGIKLSADGSNMVFDLSLYLNHNEKLNDVALNAAIGLLVGNPNFINTLSGSVTEKFSCTHANFELHQTIVGEDKALQFILDQQRDQQYGDENKIALAPYAVTNRKGLLSEPHVVLLVVKDGQSFIIDPKSGKDLGNAVPKKNIYPLGWQETLDREKCGFFVFHMIARIVIASNTSKEGPFVAPYHDLIIHDPTGSFDDLFRFLVSCGEPEHPKPKDIETGLRQLDKSVNKG